MGCCKSRFQSQSFLLYSGDESSFKLFHDSVGKVRNLIRLTGSCKDDLIVGPAKLGQTFHEMDLQLAAIGEILSVIND